MDFEMAQMNIHRNASAAELIARQFGLEIEEVDGGLTWLIRKTVKDLKFCARLDLSQYDLAPAPLSFCNPNNPIECGRQWWVKTTNPRCNVIPELNGVTGNCVVGFAEYYVFHSSAPKNRKDWHLPRLISRIGDLLEAKYIQGRGV